MKRVTVFFAYGKTFSFTGLSQEAKDFFSTRIRAKDIDVEKGGCLLFYQTSTRAVLLAHPGTKVLDPDAHQELGAQAYKVAKAYIGDHKGEVSIVYASGYPKKDRFFVEKGLLLARNEHQYFRSDYKNPSIAVNGITYEELPVIVSAIDRARELTCKPANIVTPPYIVSYCKELCTKETRLTMTVFGPKELKKERMNLFLAVSAGAQHDPAMVILEYNPENEKTKTKTQTKKTSQQAPIVLVGKGLCYDSGGLYAKPHPHMNEMYGDMAGAATVIGIMSVLAKLGIKRRVIGVLGLTENLIDEDSYKNGDIYVARNGKTVSIEHTDAEGRLVLADILSYVSDVYKPAYILDFATLTGACWAALGELYTGMFGYDEKTMALFKKIGDTMTNDRVRQLPLDRHCVKAVTEGRADVSNISSWDRIMGASTAAAFLSQFVKDTQKWIHFDIAGTALRDKMRRAYDIPKGVGTGPMIHTTLVWLMETEKKK